MIILGADVSDLSLNKLLPPLITRHNVLFHLEYFFFEGVVVEDLALLLDDFLRQDILLRGVIKGGLVDLVVVSRLWWRFAHHFLVSVLLEAESVFVVGVFLGFLYDNLLRFTALVGSKLRQHLILFNLTYYHQILYLEVVGCSGKSGRCIHTIFLGSTPHVLLLLRKYKRPSKHLRFLSRSEFLGILLGSTIFIILVFLLLWVDFLIQILDDFDLIFGCEGLESIFGDEAVGQQRNFLVQIIEVKHRFLTSSLDFKRSVHTLKKLVRSLNLLCLFYQFFELVFQLFFTLFGFTLILLVV